MLVKDIAFGTTLATIMTKFINADVPPKTEDIFPSATLIILLKKDVEAMEELKRRQGAAYV